MTADAAPARSRELILGGARSGKSRLAEERAAASGLAVTYVATATAGDAEMAARIRHHREQRPTHWRTVEAADALVPVLERECAPERFVIVDCLTLWLGSVIDAPADWEREHEALVAAVADSAGPVALVANEVGLGIVPEHALARRFRDAAGRLHQDLAAVCDRVTFVAAGLPLTLKDAPAADQRRG